MAFGELNVEVGDQRLHVVVALDLQVEGGGEGNVLLGARLDVDLLDQARVRHNLEIDRSVLESIPFRPGRKIEKETDLVAVDSVNKRLSEGDLSDARHVKAVHLIPPEGVDYPSVLNVM